MATKCIKLVTGEEILAEVSNETPEFIKFETPLALMLVGEGQLALVPWMPLADTDTFVIDKSKVILSYSPKQELINTYKQRTGGIVTAGAGALNQLPKVPSNFGR